MDISEDNFAAFGKLLLKIQFFETLLKVFISLLNDEVKQRNPRIKNLSYKDILDDNIPVRKQTLGVLMRALKDELIIFDTEEFNELLDMRNTFVHNFHKQYVSVSRVEESEYMVFIENLWNLTDKYTEIFIGMMSLTVKEMTKNSPNNLDLSGIENKEIHLYEYMNDLMGLEK